MLKVFHLMRFDINIYLWNHHCRLNIIKISIPSPQSFLLPLGKPSYLSLPCLLLRQTLVCFLSLLILFYFLQLCLIASCSMYFLLGLSLRMILRCFHVSSCLICTFLLTAEFHSIVWIDYIWLSVHQLMDIWILPVLGYCGYCYYEHTRLCADIVSFLLGIHLGDNCWFVW